MRRHVTFCAQIGRFMMRKDNGLNRKIRSALTLRLLPSICLIAALAPALSSSALAAAPTSAAADFRKDILPILSKYCFDCHGDGMSKGKVSFDEFKSDADLVGRHDLWIEVVKNLRAGLMPPEKKERPTEAERKRLENWVKYEAFGIDPKNPDPGRVTLRRLNRVEYRNTIRDLMGVDFNSEVEFPPDDTGYGFDNIGDVLTISPILLEKYMAAAKTIVAEAVPVVARVIPERTIAGSRFRGASTPSGAANRTPRDSLLSLTYYEPAVVSNSFNIELEGAYKLTLEISVKGTFGGDPGRCRIVFKLDDRPMLEQEFGWHDSKTFRFEFDEKWKSGEHQMTFALEPLTPVSKKISSLDMRFVSATIHGPSEEKYWNRPKNYERFFTREVPPTPAERQAYAREILSAFTRKAFRRPVDDQTIQKLVTVAEKVYAQPSKSFEAGIAHAIVAVLASPRFLFRVEESDPVPAGAAFANVDEYSLASRLSYFLWSTMPDEELYQLAARGQLRRNLDAQVKRMMNDPRSDAMIQNFTGQWLQARDIEGITIDARAVFARDNGTERQTRQAQEEFRARLAQRTNGLAPPNVLFFTNSAGQTNLSGQSNAFAKANAPGQTNRPPGNGNFFNRQRFNRPRIELDRDLRQAIQRETEMFFGSVVHEDRSVTDLIDCNYTFLNEKLAGLYGITNVTGTEMRRVALPPDSPRGGVLTEATTLIVTSNPDRTSPVKRGLFILDNIIGTPAPPPPGNVPALEATEKDFKDKDHDPTLRQALEVHRGKPLCASCHNRMDPIGLAFENFNALGIYREKERGQNIETAGKLVTGESFESVRELKHILVTQHRLDFYRTLSEKLLTYAIGRGMDYYDVETLDRIVQSLDRNNGHFSALLLGVIESAPFQKQRTQATPVETADAVEVNSSNPQVAKTQTP